MVITDVRRLCSLAMLSWLLPMPFHPDMSRSEVALIDYVQNVVSSGMSSLLSPTLPPNGGAPRPPLPLPPTVRRHWPKEGEEMSAAAAADPYWLLAMAARRIIRLYLDLRLTWKQ